jgi:hypothetical protein
MLAMQNQSLMSKGDIRITLIQIFLSFKSPQLFSMKINISVAEPHNLYAVPALDKNFDVAPAPTLLYQDVFFLTNKSLHKS